MAPIGRWSHTTRLDRLPLTQQRGLHDAFWMPVSLPPDPNTRTPSWTVPKGACDTHAHVFGPPDIFPYYEKRRYTPPAAPVEHYRNMQKITGLSRAVFVCPTAHGYDNRVILDAVANLGDSARGVANINSSSTPSRFRHWPKVEFAARASI